MSSGCVKTVLTRSLSLTATDDVFVVRAMGHAEEELVRSLSWSVQSYWQFGCKISPLMTSLGFRQLNVVLLLPIRKFRRGFPPSQCYYVWISDTLHTLSPVSTGMGNCNQPATPTQTFIFFYLSGSANEEWFM